jgi:MFS family permease
VLFDIHAFSEPPFCFFTLALTVSMAALYIPSFYIQTFAIQTKIIDPNLGAYVLPILNAAGMFGRVVPNFFADATGTMNMLIPFIFCAGVVVFGWIVVHNVAGLMVFAILYGFFSGAILSLPPSVIASLSPSLAVIGTRSGTSFAVASLGLLVGSPVAGAILQSSGRYVGLQVFAGALLLAAAMGMGVARICKTGLVVSKKA